MSYYFAKELLRRSYKHSPTSLAMRCKKESSLLPEEGWNETTYSKIFSLKPGDIPSRLCTYHKTFVISGRNY
jgi:hypothetical protein